MKPTCFCKPQVIDCPKCSKTDYEKMKPAQHDSAVIVKARINLRKEAA